VDDLGAFDLDQQSPECRMRRCSLAEIADHLGLLEKGDRHPPAYFIPEDDDPHCLRLSEFVIDRATEDWRYLLDQQSPTDISINLLSE
jgi:hypothetical protein